MTRPLACLASIALFTAGCSGGGAAPVSGKITFDNKPLEGAVVTFQPLHGEGSADPGSGSYGKTGPDGSYTLRLVQGDTPGAMVGKHRVEINMPMENPDEVEKGDRRPRYKLIIPKKYNVDSTLTCQVPKGGKSDANFDLKKQ
jgi:hypothetical protein